MNAVRWAIVEATKQILFVDSNASELRMIRRAMLPESYRWQASVVTNTEDAVRTVRLHRYDIVILDDDFLGQAEARLMRELGGRRAPVILVGLGPPSEKNIRGRKPGLMYGFLFRPLEIKSIQRMVSRACGLWDRLYTSKVQQLSCGLAEKISGSVTLQALNAEIASADPSLGHIGKIIAKDTAVSKKLLQMANSAFHGARQRIDDPARAAIYLGQRTVQAVIYLVTASSALSRARSRRFCVPQLLEHCNNVGVLARHICKSMSMDEHQLEDAATAGVLHDLGKITLILKTPDVFLRAITTSRERGVPLFQVERELIGTDHAALSGFLAAQWEFTKPVVEAVSFHHDPGEVLPPASSPATAVHIANAIDHQRCCRLTDGAGTSPDAAAVARFALLQWRMSELPVLDARSL